MKVSDLMRTDYVSFQADAKLYQIVKTFSEKGITSAPVFDHREFVGIVTDNELVRYFAPRKFLSLWIKSKSSPLDEMKKVTAGDLAKKPQATLSPNQFVKDATAKIAHATECIPVMDGGKVVGLIRGEDIVKFFMVELAKGELGKEKFVDDKTMDSAMDLILQVIRRDGQISCRKISDELGISFKTTEKLCEILARHHLIEINYSFLNGPVVNSFTEGPTMKVNKNEQK